MVGRTGPPRGMSIEPYCGPMAAGTIQPTLFPRHACGPESPLYGEGLTIDTMSPAPPGNPRSVDTKACRCLGTFVSRSGLREGPRPRTGMSYTKACVTRAHTHTKSKVTCRTCYYSGTLGAKHEDRPCPNRKYHGEPVAGDLCVCVGFVGMQSIGERSCVQTGTNNGHTRRRPPGLLMVTRPLAPASPPTGQSSQLEYHGDVCV